MDPVTLGMAKADAKKKYSPQVGRGERFAAKADLKSGAMCVALAGDSTGDGFDEWFRVGVARWLTDRPEINATYKAWNDTTQAYSSSVIQGSAGVDVAISDSFNRTASDIVGTTAEVGGAWSGTAGGFTLDGASAVPTTLAAGANITNAAFGGGRRVLNASVTVNTVPPTGGSYRLDLGHGLNSANRLTMFVAVANNTGAITWGIRKTIGGTSTQIGTGTGTPLLTNTPNQTIDWQLTMDGANVTAIMNGITLNATLLAGDVTALATANRLDMLTSTNLGAGIKVNSVEVVIGTPVEAGESIKIYNGSRAGSMLEYQQARLAQMYPEPVDILFVSSCHNYWEYDDAAYVAYLESFLGAYRAAHPESDIVLCSQNPQLAPMDAQFRAKHLRRLAALRAFAARNGYGYLPVVEAFIAEPDGGVSRVRSDGIHPNTTAELADPASGSYLWGDVYYKYLNALSELP